VNIKLRNSIKWYYSRDRILISEALEKLGCFMDENDVCGYVRGLGCKRGGETFLEAVLSYCKLNYSKKVGK